MKSKKVLSVLLATAMIISTLAGCGGGADTQGTADSSQSAGTQKLHPDRIRKKERVRKEAVEALRPETFCRLKSMMWRQTIKAYRAVGLIRLSKIVSIWN